MSDVAFDDVRDRFDAWDAQAAPTDPRDYALRIMEDAQGEYEAQIAVLRQALAAAHRDLAIQAAAHLRLVAALTALRRETPHWWETLAATVACGLDDLRAHWRHHARGIAFVLACAGLVWAVALFGPGAR